MLLKSLRTDLIKYKKSLAVWITLAYPFFTAILVYIILYGTSELPDNPVFMFSRSMLLVASFFLPFYLVLVITQLNYTENRTVSWKVLYAQPVSRGAIFISKLIILLILCCCAYFLLLAFALGALKLLHLHHPDLQVINLKSDFMPAYGKLIKVFISASSMMAIQYYLSLRSRNFILPLGIGIAMAILPIAIFITLGIAGIVRSQEGLATVLRVDPYTLPFSFVFNFEALTQENYLGDIPHEYLYYSASMALVVLIVAWLKQKNRNIY